jgi:U32 family peptidase
MPEQPLGQVTHYFDHVGVAVIKLTDGDLKVGDRIHVTGHSDFEQTISSMQVDHQGVETSAPGSEVAIKIDQPVKPKDKVFKLVE